MRTHKKSALFLATALLALSPSLASAKACKLKFTFKNEFPSLIKVAAMDTLYGSAENLRNKRLESGQSWTSSERSLGHATNARLVIEPGDRIRLTARFEVWDAANRTWRKARTLADRVGGQAVRLSDLPAALLEVDLLLTSTGSLVPVVEHDDFAPVMAERAGRPLLIVDIAVPRDVDPAVAHLPGVTLLNIDDLRRFAQAGVERRSHELAAVESIIDEELSRFRSAASARGAAPLVSSLHRRAEEVRAAEIAKYTARLGELDERQREAVEALTKGLVAKLLHQPTVTLKESAGSATGERLADATRQLFDLDDPA